MDKIAVIGGLGALSGADLFFKLLKNKEALKNQKNYHFILNSNLTVRSNLLCMKNRT